MLYRGEPKQPCARAVSPCMYACAVSSMLASRMPLSPFSMSKQRPAPWKKEQSGCFDGGSVFDEGRVSAFDDILSQRGRPTVPEFPVRVIQNRMVEQQHGHLLQEGKTGVILRYQFLQRLRARSGASVNSREAAVNLVDFFIRQLRFSYPASASSVTVEKKTRA